MDAVSGSVVHAVDLDAGVSFGDVPDDILTALIDDITRTWQRREELPDVRLTTGAREWGTGPVKVTGTTLSQLTAWVSGRSPTTGLTALPRWL